MIRILSVAILFILFSASLLSQDDARNNGLPISISYGIPLPTTHDLFDVMNLGVELNSGYYLSLGIQPWVTEITRHTFISFGFALTHEQASGSNRWTNKAIRKNSSLMCWSEIFVPTLIYPFIRIGGGISYHSFQEIWNSTSGPTYNLYYWSPSLGIGAGISLLLFRNIQCQIFSESIVVLKNYHFTSRSLQSDLEYTAPVTCTFGIRLIMQF